VRATVISLCLPAVQRTHFVVHAGRSILHGNSCWLDCNQLNTALVVIMRTFLAAASKRPTSFSCTRAHLSKQLLLFSLVSLQFDDSNSTHVCTHMPRLADSLLVLLAPRCSTGNVPVGVMVGSVGGSAIELWLPPGDVNSTDACGIDNPPCDVTSKNNLTDSLFWDRFIAPLSPYTVGAVVWDQGERDIRCFGPAGNHTARYACLERRLVSSWRRWFNSTFVFVAVQMPGYIGDCDSTNADPSASYKDCVPGVFDMRLAQVLLQRSHRCSTLYSTIE
jgi:hypothetical protein